MQINYFRGLKQNYNLASHGQGIYFATDTKEIIHNGAPYTGLPLNVRVEDVELDVENSTLTIKFSDGSEKKITIGSGKYESKIEDKTIAMTSAYGDFVKGTTVAQLEGKTYDELFDGILFPTVNPTFSAPSASIKFNGYSSTQEVGATAPGEGNFTVSFNAGAINLNGSKQANRAGAQDLENSYIYIGSQNKELPEIVALGSTSYYYHAAYAEGPQPKNNKGVDYSTPLAAGSVNSSAVSVNGTLPWFASTSAASAENPVIKQELVAWNSTVGNMATPKFEVQPSGTLPQVFKLPRQLKTLQMLNTVSGNMETIGTSAYTETKENININGTDYEYFVYTYKGEDRGSVTLIAKF